MAKCCVAIAHGGVTSARHGNTIWVVVSTKLRIHFRIVLPISALDSGIHRIVISLILSRGVFPLWCTVVKWRIISIGACPILEGWNHVIWILQAKLVCALEIDTKSTHV